MPHAWADWLLEWGRQHEARAKLAGEAAIRLHLLPGQGLARFEGRTWTNGNSL
jgi:hypothetical protein